jgi:hypothetical protein
MTQSQIFGVGQRTHVCGWDARLGETQEAGAAWLELAQLGVQPRAIRISKSTKHIGCDDGAVAQK